MEQALSSWLASHYATLNERDDLQLPEFDSQLQAVSAGRAYSPLTRFAVLAISGEDATAFLQGQFSCDVAALAGNGVTLGSYSTAKGRMQASFVLMATAQVYFLLVRKDIAETFRRRLSMFVLRAKVKIENVSAAMQAWLMQAPVTGKACLLATSEQGLKADTGMGVALVLSSGDALPQIDADMQAVGSEAADLVFIRAGLGWVSQATYEEFVPQMLNLELIGGISFKKGCYPGQEIVARTQYLGKVKRRMYRARIRNVEAVVEGAALIATQTGDQVIGRVVLACRIAANAFEVLLVIQSAAWEDQAKLQDWPQADIEQLDLPYMKQDAV